MSKKYLYAQTLILTLGSVYAWTSVFGDFSRFFAANGKLFSFSGCIYPNPLTIPCFYGAIAFVVALSWSIYILQTQSVKAQKYLIIFLILGTIFAWSMVSLEFYKYLKPSRGIYIGCSGLPAKNPLYTPCFTGASIYLLTLILSSFTKKSIKNSK